MKTTTTRPRVEALLTVPEVMAALKVGRTIVYDLIKSGELRSLMVGGQRRVRRAALDAHLARARPEPQRSLSVPVVIESFEPNGFFVYYLWGDDPHQPLYIGKSANVLARLGKHMNAPYARQVRRVTVLRCNSAEQMDETEARLIAERRPLLNVMLNGRHVNASEGNP